MLAIQSRMITWTAAASLLTQSSNAARQQQSLQGYCTHLNSPALLLPPDLLVLCEEPAWLVLAGAGARYEVGSAVVAVLQPAPIWVPKLKVVAVLLARGPMLGLLNTSMLTVCCRTARVGLETVRVALKCEASLLMLMEVVEVAPASPLPAGLPARGIARGVRGVLQRAAGLGDLGMVDTLRRGALGLVGRAPWCARVARGEQSIALDGLQGGVSCRGCRELLSCVTCSSCLWDISRLCTDAL